MKRFHFSILMIAILFLVSACGGGPGHMLFKEDPSLNVFNIKPETGKAALVVARTTSYGGAVEFETYLDNKMIGVTKWKSYFVKTDVAPGVHYVIIIAENVEPVKINFQPKRVYYIQEIPRMGVWKARVSVALVTPEDLRTSFDNDCKLVVYDIKNPGDDLSEKDYQQALRDYDREVKEGSHKEDVGYKGVPVK
ncbi:MAG TPA: hypothetical protein VEH06_05695 [Candidatus Bathyarchaeia archaeon]|nr:hypothetical protein [Candidatus Bathyarchaeia archaeon]